MSDEAATDTSAEGATDTGTNATESSATETPAEGAATAASAEPRFKVRRFGKEAEHTAAELRAMMDDDHEHEFHGKLGLPLLRDGKPVKLKWPEIARAVEQSHGAAEAARRHNEDLKARKARDEWGKHPDNRVTYMQDVLGIEDFDGWALQRAAEAFNKRQKMVELATSNPVEYERMLREEHAASDKRAREARDRLNQSQSQEAEQSRRTQEFHGYLGDHLKKIGGVPLNSRTKEIADEICAAWAEAKQQLPWEKLAELVRDQYHEEIFGYLDPQPDEQLLKLFGDKRRERLRAAEIAAMKGKKAEAKAAAPAAKPAASNGAPKKKGMDPDEYLRKSQNNGRV